MSMGELLVIFLFSAGVSAIFWIWAFLESYEERKRDRANGFNQELTGFRNELGGWLFLTLIVTFALWVFSR